LSKENKILFIAGEVSGDLHGAALISELKKQNSSLIFYGIGGERMKSEGLQLLEHINNMAFLGFVEVVRHLPEIRRIRKAVLDLVKKENIKTAVLIDYPGFNLNLAKGLKKLNVKVIYYITPQVWAWGKGRVKTIRKLIDKVLVILPFEKEFFSRHGIESKFVGHPLVERINNFSFPEKEVFCREHDLNPAKDILVILPGSREHEVSKIFPDAIKAAQKISEEFGLQTVVACSENIEENMFREFSGKYSFTLITGKTYELLKFSRCGIIKSGTSTLEAALLGLPMVIVYRTNPLTYLIGKNLVNLKSIGLVNIISEENIVPELIQNNLNVEKLSTEIKKYLTDEKYTASVKMKLNRLKDLLGSSKASENAAEEILGVMENA
jgi:lipid-A-disaccharide synthase